jgi:hypothetical protein
MKRASISALAAIALLVSSVPAIAQLTSLGSYEDVGLVGTGARPRGMGGAYIGVAEGAEATYWNPAGLAFLQGGKATVGFFSNNSKADTEAPNRYIPGESLTYTLDNTTNVFDFVALANGFRYSGIDFAVGASYQRVIDFGRKYSTELPSFGRVYTNRDGAEAASFALAVRPTDYFGLGAALNVYFGSFEENTYVNDPPDWWISEGDTVYLAYHENRKGSFSGTNFRFGGLFNYRDFKLGFTVSSPFQLKEKNTFMWTNISDYLIPFYGKNEAGGIANVGIDIDYPWMYGVGASYRVAGKLLLAADFESKLFSKSEITYPTIYWQPTSPDTTEDLEWEDINQYRIGLEYLLETEFAQIPIRAGYRNDPKVYTDIRNEIIDTSTTDLTRGDQVVGYVVSLGTGFYRHQYLLDFAYEFGSAAVKRQGENQGIPFDTESKEKVSRFFITGGLKF